VTDMFSARKRAIVAPTSRPPSARGAVRRWLGRAGLAVLLGSVLAGRAPGGAPLPVAASAPPGAPVRPAESGPLAGFQLEQRAPDFVVTGLGGEPITGADLLAQGKPFVLYFFATWCTTCRAEFRTLKDVYPRYADRVNFVAVGIDPGEGPEALRAYQEGNGYPWTVALGDREVLERFNVISTSVKYAIDRQGTIAFQRGYGVEDAGSWERVFEGLLQR
jgi:thiol-disulfide isomerase/thioredoxin